MRLNTYPGLKQGSTEHTNDKRQADVNSFCLLNAPPFSAENLSAGPNIQAFPVKSLTNLIRGDGSHDILSDKYDSGPSLFLPPPQKRLSLLR
ncbi:uncharacterized protein BO88DRAFT_409122 [Aspergillus vadensis CBS 113365]|uniref:Uncharacterized protein n=1 Tax=Aspergillus vadensis (strain CBS 113365 / IMI 142717 / IBT 24658) TaxID=1448311 RepID=A0A319C438_ASPVC|nr:hypothetical protein BO88DRAFT_409122 [Aspergillus vadensis CBS 113365]PYH63572.1 hypothetical protein BO88DRAFT_409122 [Aspergillus vadensis CBS 113365]